MCLVVRARVKRLAKGYKCSGSFLSALDELVEEVIEGAVCEAKREGRTTLIDRYVCGGDNADDR